MPKVDVQARASTCPDLRRRGGFVVHRRLVLGSRVGDTGYRCPAARPGRRIVAGRKSGATAGYGHSQARRQSQQLAAQREVGGHREDGRRRRDARLRRTSNSAKAITERRDGDGPHRPGAGGRRGAARGRGQERPLDAWVGDDQILRRVSLDLSGKGTGGRSVAVSLDFELSGVNKPQDIAPPAKVKNALPAVPRPARHRLRDRPRHAAWASRPTICNLTCRPPTHT